MTMGCLERGFVPPPKTLRPEELKWWYETERKLAPIVVGDGLSQSRDEMAINLGWTSWVGLYGLSLILARAFEGRAIATYTPTNHDRDLLTEPLVDPSVLNEFQSRAAAMSSRFLSFLRDWDLARYLGTPEPPLSTSINAPQIDEERKILGLHLFEDRNSIEQYVLLWKTNPNAAPAGISSERVVAARGIDLICSELLANAFEHGGAPKIEFDIPYLKAHCDFVDGLRVGTSLSYGRLRDLVSTHSGMKMSAAHGRMDAGFLGELAKGLNAVLNETELIKDEWLSFQSFRSRSTQKYEEDNSASRLRRNRLVLEDCFPCHCPLPRPFIMAKVCLPDSARAALSLHRKRPYLEQHELVMYENARDGNHSILQLVIGDFGGGFEGNARLVKQFEDAGIKKTAPSSGQIIEYALQPEVSTKLFSKELIEQWRSYMQPGADMAMYVPRIHGLSEVQNFVQEWKGFWRIHSNGTLYDHCLWNNDDKGRRLLSPIVNSTYMEPISGCLHYIAIPLRKKAHTHVVMGMASHKAAVVEFVSFPSPASCTSAAVGPDQGETWWELGLRQVVARVLLLKGKTDVVVISLHALDDVQEENIPHVCAVLIDLIHRVRQHLAVLVVGGGDRLLSYFRRFAAWKDIFLDRYVLPVIDVTPAGVGVTVCCGEELAEVRGDIEDCILGKKIRDNLTDERRLSTLQETAEHNRGLFEFRESQLVLRAAIDLRSEQWQQVLLGGWSPTMMASKIHELGAAGRFKQLQRFGENLSFYLHLGRLWSDEGFRHDIRGWLSNVLRLVVPTDVSEDLNNAKSEYCIVSLLQPATDIVRLVRMYDPLMRRMEFVSLRNMSELRWDSGSMTRLAGKKIVCVCDIIRTGNTVTLLEEAATALSAKVVGYCTVLKIGDFFRSNDNALCFPFCRFSAKDFSQIENGTREGVATASLIVDGDTQSVAQVKLQNLAEWKKRSSRALRMLNHNHLVIGHGVFGDKHHIVYARLAGADDELRSDIMRDIRETCEGVLEGLPHIVLYPSDSTVFYLFRERWCLGARHYVALSAKKMGYGHFELRLEASRTVLRLADDEPKRILFIDDSRSSGDTEMRAFETYLRERSKARVAIGKEAVRDKWLSYVVLSRKRPGDLGGSEPEKNYGGRGGHSSGLQLSSASYSKVGALSLSRIGCPFEDAERAILYAIQWLRFTRPKIQKGLHRLLSHVECHSIEEPNAVEVLLEGDASQRFLWLVEMDSANAAVATTENRGDGAHVTASCLFLAVHYGECCAYLSPAQLIATFKAAAQFVKGDPERTEILLVCAALLPCSMSQKVIAAVVEKLLEAGHVDAVGCMLATLFAKFDSHVEMLMQSVSCDSNSDDDESSRSIGIPAAVLDCLRDHRHDCWQALWDIVERCNQTGRISATLDVVRSDLLVLRDISPRNDVVTTARQLGGLIAAGRRDHASSLRSRLDAGEMEFVHPLVRTTYRCAKSLLDYLGHSPENAQQEMEQIADRAYASVKNAPPGEKRVKLSGEYRERVLEYFQYLEQDSPFSRHFVQGTVVHNMLLNARARLLQQLVRSGADSEVADQLMVISPCPDTIRRRSFLMSDAAARADLFGNLLSNPFDHFFGKTGGRNKDASHISRVVSSLKAGSRKMPFITSFLSFHAPLNRLVLVVLDQGSPANRENLFAVDRGLGNSRLLLDFVGGKVEYFSVAELIEQASGYIWDCTREAVDIGVLGTYTNLFAVESQALWEVSGEFTT